MSSIIIMGKGPSLLRCTKDFVDKYDDIAICGCPPLVYDFLKLVRNRKIKYHFCNCGDPHLKKNGELLYDDRINNHFNIEEIYDIGAGKDNYIRRLNNKSIYKENLKKKYLNEFITNHGFNEHGPSCGIYSLHHILNTKKYNKISLVGFDNFQQGKQRYFFPVKDYNPSLLYLIGRDITHDNINIIKSLHDSTKTKEYMIKQFNEKKNIDFKLYSNINFDDTFDNVIIY